MIPTLDDKRFMADMNNILNYAIGFIDGAKMGKIKMLNNLGQEVSEMICNYIDSSARVDPQSLHHVYEWYQTGSPDARLFDISYVANSGGLSINSTLTQSMSVQSGSKVPFYNKAEIMERGISMRVAPKDSTVLAFDDNGETVFTRKPVTISDPGGPAVQGEFERTLKQFFSSYMSQAILSSSGIMRNLGNPVDFKTNLRQGKTGGRATGVKVGYNWMTRSSN